MAQKRRLTDTKERTKLIESHIMESFDTTEELIEAIRANIFGERVVRQACYDTVHGGCLLVYHGQINEFLEKLNCKVSDNDEANWSMYKKLVASRMEKIYQKYIN